MNKILLVIFIFFISSVNADVFCPEPNLSDWPKQIDLQKHKCDNNLSPEEESKLGRIDLKFDLNGDSICEYFVNVGGAGGGIEYHVYTKLKNELKNILMYFTWNINIRERKNGWYTLYSHDVSGDKAYHSLFAYSDNGYEINQTKEYQCERP